MIIFINQIVHAELKNKNQKAFIFKWLRRNLRYDKKNRKRISRDESIKKIRVRISIFSGKNGSYNVRKIS